MNSFNDYVTYFCFTLAIFSIFITTLCITMCIIGKLLECHYPTIQIDYVDNEETIDDFEEIIINS